MATTVDLVVDAGNTRTKAAILENGVIIKVIQTQVDQLIQQLPCSKFNRIMVSSTRGVEQHWIEDLNSKCDQFLWFQPETPVPFPSKYETPKTLGRDRLAAIAGAIHRYPDQAILAIDMGTCITYDFYAPEQGYLGGAISPGVEMRFKALADYTYALPKVEFSENWSTIGTSTIGSITSGVIQAVCHEIEGYQAYLWENFQSEITVLTGGNAQSFVTKLKKPIFAHPELTLEGLYQILEFNINA